jgi:hypothetical protein
MAELVADPLESEERTRALQCVLRLGQVTLFERAEEASCFAGVSGGNGFDAAETGTAAHAQQTSRRTRASLTMRMRGLPPDPATTAGPDCTRNIGTFLRPRYTRST